MHVGNKWDHKFSSIVLQNICKQIYAHSYKSIKLLLEYLKHIYEVISIDYGFYSLYSIFNVYIHKFHLLSGNRSLCFNITVNLSNYMCQNFVFAN